MENPQPLAGNESPKAFIRRIRTQTCYGFLRGAICGCLVLNLLGVFYSVCFLIIKYAQEYGPGVLVAGILVMAVLSAIIIAIWQFAILFIDMADTLIEQNRRK